MKYRHLIILIFLTSVLPLWSNPSFTVGSNPYMTVFAFPHKLLQWHYPAVVFGFNYFPMPWQGNISDPKERPNDSYTSNYQSFFEGNPEDYSGSEDMSTQGYFGGYYDHYALYGGSVFPLGEMVTYLEAGIDFHRMSMTASGRARGYTLDSEDNREYILADFNALTENSQFTVSGQGILAGHLGEYPFGLKLEAEYFFPNSVKGHLNYTLEGVDYDSPHLTWGWATVGCSNIFNFEHRESVIDSFYLNRYDISSGIKASLQGSLQHGIFETALRTRITRLYGDLYRWNETEGQYITSEDTLVADEKNMIRLYSKMSLFQHDPVNAGLLLFLEYDQNREAEMDRNSGSEFIPSRWYEDFSYIIEVNPFLNLAIGRQGYLDVGILVEGAYEPGANKQLRGNGSGNEEVYSNSSSVVGWSPYWERFSYEDLFFFATGFESTFNVPVSRSISLSTTALSLLKLTWERKSYGSTNDVNESLTYEEETHRWNFKRELWMTGGVSVNYRVDKWVFNTILQFPLAYLIYTATELFDNQNETLFQSDANKMFQVQEPFKLRLQAILAL